MKKIIFFILTIIFFLISCQREPKQTIETIKFDYQEQLEFPLPDNLSNRLLSTEIYQSDTGTFLFVLTQNFKFLIYNLETQKLISEVNTNRQVNAAKIINLDSILILSRKYGENYDSTIFLCDYKGNIKKYYSVKGMPLLSVENYFQTTDSIAMITTYGLIPYNNNTAKFNLMLYYYDSLAPIIKMPISATLNLKTDTFTLDNLYSIPDFDTSNIAPEDLAYSIGISSVNNNYVYSFLHSPTIWIENSGKTISKKTSSIFIDTINLTLPFSFDQNYYLPFIIEDKIQSKLLRFVNYQKENKLSAIILDSNYTNIGETFFPLRATPMFYNNKAYFINKDKMFKKDKTLIIDVYDYQYSKIPLSDFLNETPQKKTEKNADSCKITIPDEQQVVKNNSDTKKLSNHFSSLLQDTTFQAIIVPVFYGCHSCVDYVLKMYQMNQNFFSDANVYLIASGENIPAIEDKLTEFEISPFSKNVIIDTSGIYFETFLNTSAQHLAKIDNDSLTFLEEYFPDELDSIMTDIFSNLDVQYE